MQISNVPIPPKFEYKDFKEVKDTLENWNRCLNEIVAALMRSRSVLAGLTTDDLAEGVTYLYFTPARVLSTLLTGYTATSGTISATDSVLTAIQKLGYAQHVPITLSSIPELTLTGQQLSYTALYSIPLTADTAKGVTALGYLDQSVKTSASPSFAGLTIGTLAGHLFGTAGVVGVASNTTNLASINQNLGTTSDPTFRHLNVTDVTGAVIGPLTLTTGALGNDSFMSSQNVTYLFYLDASADKIGIGTNTPSYTLDVVGTLRTTGAVIFGNSLSLLEGGASPSAFTNFQTVAQSHANLTYQLPAAYPTGFGGFLKIGNTGAWTYGYASDMRTFLGLATGDDVIFNSVGCPSGTTPKIKMSSGGTLDFGPGTGTFDLHLSRGPASGQMRLDGDFGIDGKLRLMERAGATYFTIIGAGDQAADISWTLPIAQGGVGTVLSNNGSGVLSWVAALTTALTSAHIFVGNGSNVATDVAMSGDVTIDNTGATTIGSKKVTGAKIADTTIADGQIATNAAIATSKIAGFSAPWAWVNFQANGTIEIGRASCRERVCLYV